MSDAVRCAICGYVYWSGKYENWGTCGHCDYNNDHIPQMMQVVRQFPRLVDSDKIFKFLDEDDNVVEKSIYIKGEESKKEESFVPAGENNIQERLKRVMESKMSKVADAGPIYTEKQKEYVAVIKDEDLRDALLHHVRLSDLMSKDRDKALKHNYELEDQVTALRAKLRECCSLIGIKTD